MINMPPELSLTTPHPKKLKTIINFINKIKIIPMAEFSEVVDWKLVKI
jgi:hypothetical protein